MFGRATSGHRRPLAGASAPLSAGAEVRTSGTQEADVLLRDGVQIAVRPLSRIVLPVAERVDVHFGGVEVDMRRFLGPGSPSTIAVVLTGTELRGERAMFEIRTYVHDIEVTVRDGIVVMNGADRIVAGECRSVPRVGLGVRYFLSRGPLPAACH